MQTNTLVPEQPLAFLLLSHQRPEQLAETLPVAEVPSSEGSAVTGAQTLLSGSVRQTTR